MISVPSLLLIICGLGIGCAAVYPYISYLLKIRTLPSVSAPEIIVYPSISVVINAYKEGPLVKTRIENVFQSQYPKDRLTLYVVNDGADPATSVAAKESLVHSPVKSQLIEPEMRLGKIRCQNMMLSAIEDEIIVFTDADITTKPDALVKLVAHLQNPEVGAVCADLVPVGSTRSVTGSEGAYRSVYGKMCEYDSLIDSTYNFNGPLIAFKKSAVPHIEETTGADDANLALTCITNGYRAIYAVDAVAYELQPVSFREQYHQKIRRADGLINSTRHFQSSYSEKRKLFWKQIFPLRRWMLLYSPLLFVVSTVLLCAGFFLWSVLYCLAIVALVIAVLMFSLIKPDNLLSSFVLNQFYLLIGLLRRKNIQLWDRVEK
ncbi:glycosyltransferase [Methanorbis rubei]|uniref:Glycosyltransferase 2-like domain-containing protein n=1 Tax=Methanorbis rubei TaxID=3028300 RepID=A0AAE4MFG4_9EURY|nr:hypothetical protein [Methanocorpusculaceae archaeon Cs1]